METSQVAEGGEGLIKSGELQACSSEHYLQPEPTGVIRSAGGVPLLPGNVVQGLYPVAQPSLGNASNMELSLDHFDISFSNQFSDLINDFISVEGGGGTIYGHQLVSGDGTALSQSEDGARAPFTQAEMCIPCCSPQQGSLQLSSAEGGAGTMAYMHVAEVVSAASASGTLGMLQQSGRVFMVTDYSPEWSYPEVSCHCRHHPSPALPAHLPTCFTCQPPHLPHLSHLPHHLPTCQHAARDACLHVAALPLKFWVVQTKSPPSVPMALEIPPPLSRSVPDSHGSRGLLGGQVAPPVGPGSVFAVTTVTWLMC